MDAVDAEEYTQALGQVVAGGWRQVALGQRLGVPQALGMSTAEWVEARLGGYLRMSIPDRREAVRELTAPIEDGGQGLSTREAAAILGLAQSTVVEAKRTERNRSDQLPTPDAALDSGERFRSDDASWLQDEVRPEAQRPTLADAVAAGQVSLADLPSPRLSRAERAYTMMGPLVACTDTDPADVAATCAPEDLEDRITVIGCLAHWIVAVCNELERRRAQPLTLVGGSQRGAE